MEVRQSWVLVCAGMNLILAQYWMVREYQLAFASSEIALLLAVVSFFASCSLGYLHAPKRLGRFFPWLCLLLFLLHLFLPWMFKEVAAIFYRRALPHITPALMGMGILLVAPLYTVLLPLFVRAREQVEGRITGEAVTRCYGLELCGALTGIVVILTAGRAGILPLLIFYFLNFSFILAYVFGSRNILYLTIPVSLLYGLLYIPLERAASEDFYRSREFDPNIRLLATAQSLYNRIDVLQKPLGEKLLLLNGREYFNPTDLEVFNRYLSGLPSDLMPGSRVLIVGAGSMSSVYHASRHAASVESVELDEQVVRLAREQFRAFNRLDHVRNWTLHIDDAKHFLGATAQQYDLIIVDLVPPVYVQTALLFSKEFYELAKRRLSPTGVLSIYTGHMVDRTSMAAPLYSPIATIEAVFPEYLVVSSQAAENGFVYASSKLPFGRDEVARLLVAPTLKDGETVLTREEVRPLLAGSKATSMDDLGIVMEWAPSSYREPLLRSGDKP